MAQGPGNPEHGPQRFQIFVDGQHFTVTQTAMTGALRRCTRLTSKVSRLHGLAWQSAIRWSMKA